MFDKERFIEECVKATPDGATAVREIVLRAVSEPAAIIASLGEPAHAGITLLYRSKDLTILQFVWAPYMGVPPHNHQMFSVAGIYAGREDNVFWRREESRIAAAGARSLGAGEVATLGAETIHSVLNPLGKLTCALHVYGGDFFEPPSPRSQWDHETLQEEAWDINRVRTAFAEAEARAARR